MEFIIHTRKRIESTPPPAVPHVVISITTSPHDEARIPETPAFRGILRLAFFDSDLPPEEEGPEGLFAAADARRIWDFVLAHRAQVACVVLHCNAGLSRSPGVAAALARALDGEDAEFFARYKPNSRVYRILLDVYAAEYAGR